MTATVDILIPTYNRPTALAVTLATLIGQTTRDFRVVIADQTEDFDVADIGEVQTVIRALRFHGHTVEVYKNLPRRGLAQQRHFLLDHATAPYVLFSDNDVIFEPDAVAQMVGVIQKAGCGFVGSALIGLSYLDDVRPQQQAIEFWDGAVEPETIEVESAAWQRYKLHNAANLHHVAQNFGITPDTSRLYKVAWVGGCAIFDTAKLRDVGGFDFWRDLPPKHAGEDVLAQLRVMAKYGGAGLIPTRVYHQELPTTVPERDVDAPKFLTIHTDSDAAYPADDFYGVST